jgi:hypothetical protein
MAERWKAKEATERYLAFLAEEGYRPKINVDGDVAFKCEGASYVIQIDESDEQYFRLVYPNFWRIKSDEELAQAKEAALAVTTQKKVVKILLAGKTNTWATVELFCSPPETFMAVFNRCLSALRGGVNEFVALMQESQMQQDDFVFHLPTYKMGSN